MESGIMADYEKDVDSDDSEGSGDQKEKTLRPPCSDLCSLKCTIIITENQRKQILKYFYGLGDINLRRLFVQKCVERNPEFKKDDGTYYNYHFTINGRKIKVCKVFFLSTLSITFGFVLRSLEIIFDDQIAGGSYKKQLSENRASIKETKKLDSKIEDGILQHIKSVPRIVTCSSDQTGKRSYTEYSIKSDTMYDLYLKYCKDKGLICGSIKKYKELFERQNIVFRKCQKSLPLLQDNEVTIVTLKS